jgi:hypothetical protein
MLHNTGPYGPNETPVNMGAAVNLPDLNNPVNIAQNFNNLMKMSQQATNSAGGHFNFQNYASFADATLGNSSQMHNFPQRLNPNIQESIATQDSSLLHNSIRQNRMLVERLNLQAPPAGNLLQHPYLGRFNQFNTFGSVASSLFDIANKNKDSSEIPENATLSISANKSGKITHLNKDDNFYVNDKTEFPKSKDNTKASVNNTEHITIDKPKINNENCNIDKDSYRENESNQSSNKIDNYNYASDVDMSNDSDEHTTKENETEKRDVTQTDSDSEDMLPLALTQIKKEPDNDTETSTLNINVKIEQINSWTDTDFMQPYLRDINGKSRELSSNAEIVSCDTSIVEAMEIIQSGKISL